jgi:hypothetical protein
MGNVQKINDCAISFNSHGSGSLACYSSEIFLELLIPSDVWWDFLDGGSDHGKVLLYLRMTTQKNVLIHPCHRARSEPAIPVLE